MPTPTDHRDVTYTSPGQENAVINSHFDTLGTANFPSTIRFADLSTHPGSEITEHQVTLKAGTSDIAVIYWRRTGASSSGSWTLTKPDVRNPPDSGTPALPGSPVAGSWQWSRPPNYTDWTFRVDVWATAAASHKIAVVGPTAIGFAGARFDITVKTTAGALVYEGSLTTGQI